MTQEVMQFGDLTKYNTIRRTVHEGKTYYSVVDIIAVLTDSESPSVYWTKLKERENQLLTICQRLKFISQDGRLRLTDAVTQEGALRLVQSVPSPKAEPFKQWLAKVGAERLEENKNPALGVTRAHTRAVANWKKQGMTGEWIKNRMESLSFRNQLTDIFKDAGVTNPREYAIRTNKTHTATFGIDTAKHKELKGLKNENLRDNMVPTELKFMSIAEGLLATLLEDGKSLDTAQEIQKKFSETTRESYEKATGKKLATAQRPRKELNDLLG